MGQVNGRIPRTVVWEATSRQLGRESIWLYLGPFIPLCHWLALLGGLLQDRHGGMGRSILVRGFVVEDFESIS